MFCFWPDGRLQTCQLTLMAISFAFFNGKAAEKLWVVDLLSLNSADLDLTLRNASPQPQGFRDAQKGSSMQILFT